MSSFKQLNKADVTTVPYAANKRWSFSYDCPSLSNNNFNIYKGTYIDGDFYPNDPSIDPITNDQYERLIYDVINHMFYQSYSGSLLNTGSLMFNIETYESASQQRPTNSYFNYNINPNLIKNFPTGVGAGIRVINFTPQVYGSKILPATFKIESSGSAIKIIDDGYGNLFDVGGLEDDYALPTWPTVDYFDDLTPGILAPIHVGNIFYAHGIAVVTNFDYQEVFPLPPLAYNDVVYFEQATSPKNISVLNNDVSRSCFLDTGSIILYENDSSYFTANNDGTITLNTSTAGIYEIYYTVNSKCNNECSLISNKAKVSAIVIPSAPTTTTSTTTTTTTAAPTTTSTTTTTTTGGGPTTTSTTTTTTTAAPTTTTSTTTTTTTAAPTTTTSTTTTTTTRAFKTWYAASVFDISIALACNRPDNQKTNVFYTVASFTPGDGSQPIMYADSALTQPYLIFPVLGTSKLGFLNNSHTTPGYTKHWGDISIDPQGNRLILFSGNCS